MKILDITREERYFTSFLFHAVRENPRPLLKILKERGLFKTIPDHFVDLGFEVCLFRDYARKNLIRRHKQYEKVTFDLLLQTKDKLVIFELKAQQPLSIKQTKYQLEAIAALKNEENFLKLEIILCAITSSGYNPKITQQLISRVSTWDELALAYPDYGSIFSRANEIYAN